MRIKSDPKKLLVELEYYIKYYGSEFKPNQGLEVIIQVIRMYSKNGSWLDLGGGSNSPFWRMFFPKLDRIMCVDINPEAFLLSELIINEFIESPCYNQTRQMFGNRNGENSNIEIKYKRMDLLSEDIVFDCKFDNITQFGLLGLLRDEDEFIKKTRDIMNALKRNGVYIGVNWIFSKIYQKKIGFSNEYISERLLSNIETRSIKLIYYEEVEIKNDPNYDKCIIYVIKGGEKL